MGTVEMVSQDPRAKIRRDAVGMAAYAAAFGASFGAVSVASGLDVAQTMMLSLVMFSGASQFALIGVIGGGGAGLAAAGAALLLGVRNTFYGIPMARILGKHGLRGRRRAIAAQLVIDETTAMAVGQDDPPAQRYAFWTTGVLLFLLWNTGSLVGAIGGLAMGDPATLGLDAVAPAAFLALLWPRLREPSARWVAVAGAAAATVLVPLLPPGVPVLAAAPVAVVAGLLPRRSAPEGAA